MTRLAKNRNLSQEEVKKLKKLVSAAMEAEDAAIRAADQAQEEYAAAVREAIRERREADEARMKLVQERLRVEELERIIQCTNLAERMLFYYTDVVSENRGVQTRW
jgi:hypothetical protein